MNTSPPTSADCRCQNWCREGAKYWTDHHLNCERHIPGTILICKVSINGASYYDHRLHEAVEVHRLEPESTLESVVVSQEEYEALPEFDGF